MKTLLIRLFPIALRTNFDTLFIFANPPKPPVPPGAKYFGPGIHNMGVDYRLLPSEHDVYLDGGAWVVGSINISDAKQDVHIMGPGTLSGEFEVWENVKDLPWPETFPYMMIHTDYTHSFSNSFELIKKRGAAAPPIRLEDGAWTLTDESISVTADRSVKGTLILIMMRTAAISPPLQQILDELTAVA